MKLAEILDILSTAELTALTRDQLLELAATDCGKAFAADLQAYSARAADRRDDIAAVVHSLADACKGVLEQLRYEFVVDQVVKVAKQEKRRFFSAPHAISTSSHRKADAERYLSTLGLARAAGDRASAARLPVAAATSSTQAAAPTIRSKSTARSPRFASARRARGAATNTRSRLRGLG